jgi:hypothetical protein
MDFFHFTQRGPKGSLDTYIDSKRHIVTNMLLDPEYPLLDS